VPWPLRQSVVPALVASGGAAILAVILLVAGARWWIPQQIDGPVAESGWTRRSRAAFVPSGFHPAELDPSSGRSFSWSREQARLEFPALRRTRAYLVTLTVRGVRPPHLPQADVTIAVDEDTRFSGAVSNETSEIAFEIRRGDSLGAAISIDVRQPYVPGGGDPRTLGVIVDRVAFSPVNGAFVPAAETMRDLALAVFVAVLGLWLCGLRGALGAAAAATVAAGCAWLMLQDGAFIGTFSARLVPIAVGCLIVGAVIGQFSMKWPSLGGVPEWNIAVGLILAVSLVKIGLFSHPLAIVGDGIFQVHRAQVVHGGNYLFTSVTPKPFFEFPYPVALYVFAQPFWSWFPSELDLLRLLRTIAVVADGVAGVILYGAVRRQWNNRAAALLCAVLWPLARAPFEAMSNANLTNLFGQSMFGAALAGVAWMAAASTLSMAAAATVGVLLAIAFLSHFGTVTVGLAMLGIAGAALLILGRGHPRRVGVTVFAVLFAAVLASWIVYYSNFTEVYRRTWTAVAERQSDDSSKMVAAPAVKLERWWAGTGDDYGRPGVPVLLATLAGMILLLRQPRTGAGVVFLAWLVAWIALSALGILTPLTLRANLAAAPAFTALSALAVGAMASRGGVATLAAWVAGAFIAMDGWRVALACLRLG
jgi:hypothetical protein